LTAPAFAADADMHSSLSTRAEEAAKQAKTTCEAAACRLRAGAAGSPLVPAPLHRPPHAAAAVAASVAAAGAGVSGGGGGPSTSTTVAVAAPRGSEAGPAALGHLPELSLAHKQVGQVG